MELFEGDGMPLELFGDRQLASTDVTLTAGELVLLYSDGFSEARCDERALGTGCLLGLMEGAATLNAQRSSPTCTPA